MRQRDLLPGVASGLVTAGARRRGEFRYRFVRDLWVILKRTAAQDVRNVEIREVAGLADLAAEAYIDDRTRAVVAAVCRHVGCESFFEIGTAGGRTTWSVVRTNPNARAWTFDLPVAAEKAQPALDVLAADRPFMLGERRGTAFRDTPEGERIEQVLGDSATFDFSPFHNRMDVVFVDGAHSYNYARNDTEVALRLLRPGGTIIWDDYPYFPGVYAYVNEFAREHPGRVVHLFDTRLAIYSAGAPIA